MYRASEAVFNGLLTGYERSLSWVLRHQFPMLLVTVGTIVLTVVLYIKIPKGFFPEQDTGRLSGFIKTDQDTSFQSMSQTLGRAATAVAGDKDIADVLAFSGGRGAFNQAQMFATLEPEGKRKDSVGQVMARLRGQTARIPGASVIFQPVQDIRIGGRSSSSQYQYSLRADNLADLIAWAPKMLAKMRTMAADGIVDVDTDQQNGGLQADLSIDRDTAGRLGITPQVIDQVLYDAFGQEQVSVMYTQLNQYHVVMEVSPQFWQNPTDGLRHIYVPAANGRQVPLSAFTTYKADTAPLSVNHAGQFPCVTLSFNLTPGTSLGSAVASIQDAGREIGLPATVQAASPAPPRRSRMR